MRAAAAAEQLQQMEIQMEDSAEDLGPVGTGRVYGRAEGALLYSRMCMCLSVCLCVIGSIIQTFFNDDHGPYITSSYNTLLFDTFLLLYGW